MKAVACALAAAGAVAGIAVADRPDRPDRVTVRFLTPAGDRGTLSVLGPAVSGTQGWCGRVAVRRGGLAVERAECGEGGGGRRLHGAFVADCRAREAIVFGTLASGATVRQLDVRGGAAVAAVAAVGQRPRGVRFDGGFYAIGVDLRAARPVLRATDADGRAIGRHDFTAEKRRCATSGGAIVGGF